MNKYIPRLLNIYNTDVKFKLQKKLNINNVMQIPKIQKIVLNMGIGDARDNKTSLKQAIEEITLITGQKPIVTKAKKAISNFKIRIGDPVGVKVTLRKVYMYEFLDRFISITSPRIRDFRGFSFKGFDGRGNYNFGITEQIIFSEIDYDKINSIRGINVSFITSTANDSDAYTLLQSFGFPINKYIKEKLPEKKLSKKDLKEETPVEEKATAATSAEEVQAEDGSVDVAIAETLVEEAQTEETTTKAPAEEVQADETSAIENSNENNKDNLSDSNQKIKGN